MILHVWDATKTLDHASIVGRERQQHTHSQDSCSDYICPICIDCASSPITLECGHTWCKRCLISYLLAAVNTRLFPLLCMGGSGKCSDHISLKIAQSLLSSEDFHHVARAAFFAYIHWQSRPSDFHHCPTPDCPHVYRNPPVGALLRCPSCLIRICGKCHVKHHDGRSCLDSENEDLRMVDKWSVGRDVKRCPSCRIVIEKVDGCKHVACAHCHAHICWECLSFFDVARDCYRHMRGCHGVI